MTIRLEFKPRDMWVGAYVSHYDIDEDQFPHKRRWELWICILPMLPIHLSWLREDREMTMGSGTCWCGHGYVVHGELGGSCNGDSGECRCLAYHDAVEKTIVSEANSFPTYGEIEHAFPVHPVDRELRDYYENIRGLALRMREHVVRPKIAVDSAEWTNEQIIKWLRQLAGDAPKGLAIRLEASKVLALMSTARRLL